MSDDILPSSMLGVDQLATALAKAQAEIVGAEKSRKNDHFKSSYATLADTWEACRGPLTKHGLSIVQLVGATANGVTVETRLLHSSGQSLSSILELPVGQKTAQGIGSAITYGRRYGLSAMVGVAPDEDDDGNTASNRQGAPQEQRQQQAQQNGSRTEQVKQQVAQRVQADAPATTEQPASPWEKIRAMYQASGLDLEKIGSWLKGTTGKSSSAQLTPEDVETVKQVLLNMAKNPPAQQQAAPAAEQKTSGLDEDALRAELERLRAENERERKGKKEAPF